MDKRPLIQHIISGMGFCDSPSDYWTANHMLLDFPESEIAKTIEQRNGQSVWDHTMLVLDNLRGVTPIALLSGLFHDLGKTCITPINDPKSRFPNHNIESAKIAEKRLRAWGASPYMIDRVVKIVSTHMYDITGSTKDKTIRKFIASIGQDNVANWLLLRIADSRAYSNHGEYYSRTINPFKFALTSYLLKQPSSEQQKFTGSDSNKTLQINGGDA